MANGNDDSLFFDKNYNQSVTQNTPLGGNDKGIKNKLINSAKDLALDVKETGVDFLQDVKSSIKDRFTLSSKRNSITDSIEYGTEEVSIANRHRDAITGILDNTFSGNLFDAGVSTLNLLNFGTKWKIAYKQEVDRNIYPFKYLYYYNPLYKTRSSDKGQTEDDVPPSLTFLDDIEDPTILGFTLKIDYENSPLFKNVVKSVDFIPSDKSQSEADVNNTTNSSVTTKDMENSALGFINDYKSNHPELNYATLYLQDFTNACNKIFISPDRKQDYNTIKYKNSYIYEIKGLNKLDNPFVEYKEDKEHESLELTLGEDVRMYVNRMAFLYRNLTWSYNMGKKLIPENMLRFNMYIKISEMRNFTSNIKDSNGDDENENTLVDAIRNGYSRVIYELKDCEFSFDESILPETLSVGGFNDITENYADLKVKIKYRKVNRIFYSKLFSSNFAQNLIGDKFYTPNTAKYLNDLRDMGYSSESLTKNKSYSNNIPVVQSLSSRLDTLKNKGLLNEDNNDTALTRFAKSIGNKAIKAGATVLDDKMQQAKTSINDLGKNIFNNNLSSQVRDLLKTQIQTKSNILGKSLHLNTGKQFTDLNEVVNFTSSNLSSVNNPTEDLHPDMGFQTIKPAEDLHPITNFKTLKPTEDLHPITNFKPVAPSEDLHPDLNLEKIAPNEDLHPTIDFETVAPSEDLHPETNFQTMFPNEDLHPDLNLDVISPAEDLHPTINLEVKSPNEDLHPSIKNNIIDPSEDVHPNLDNNITTPVEDLHSSVKNNIIAPSENINNVVNSSIQDPKENVNTESKSIISSPNEDVHPKVDNNIKNPKEDIKDNFTKFIKKGIDTPPSNSALGDC